MRPDQTHCTTLGLTSLDHVCQVGLGQNLGGPEHHQGILGVDQVGPRGPVQEALEQLGVEQQVLVDKRLPAAEVRSANRTGANQKRQAGPLTICPARFCSGRVGHLASLLCISKAECS